MPPRLRSLFLREGVSRSTVQPLRPCSGAGCGRWEAGGRCAGGEPRGCVLRVKACVRVMSCRGARGWRGQVAHSRVMRGVCYARTACSSESSTVDLVWGDAERAEGRRVARRACGAEVWISAWALAVCMTLGTCVIAACVPSLGLAVRLSWRAAARCERRSGWRKCRLSPAPGARCACARGRVCTWCAARSVERSGLAGRGVVFRSVSFELRPCVREELLK